MRGWNRKLVTARVFDRVGYQRVAVGTQRVPLILVCDSAHGLLLTRFGIFYFCGVPLIVNPSEGLGENEGWKDRNSLAARSVVHNRVPWSLLE